jgi:hypothetical protein
VDTLLAVSDAFRHGERAALAALAEVTSATARWPVVADRAGLDRADIEQTAPAFEHEQSRRAHELVAG